MDDPTVLPARHRLHVDDYHRMVDSGRLGKDDRVELINGDLIDMVPIGQGHAATVAGLAKALFVACGDRAIVWPQNPVLIDPWSEPQPDLAVLRPQADFYATGERPGPADVLLIVQVANSSLRFDRGVKLPLYARAGVAEVWIVDLQRRLVDAYRMSAADMYQETHTCRAGEQVSLALAPEIVVTLNLMFG